MANARVWFYSQSFNGGTREDSMATGQYETTNLRAIESAHWCVCGLPYGLTYQSCRFCGTSWPKVKGLFKYAVRHYICAECRDKKLNSAQAGDPAGGE